MIARAPLSSALLVAAVVALVSGVACREPAPPPAIRFSVSIPAVRTLGAFALSPDGRWLAYSAEREPDGSRRLFIRSLADAHQTDRELPETGGASVPFFSPDGATVAYFSRGSIWRTPVSAEGVPEQIVAAPSDSAGGTWTSDGRIVFAPLGKLGLMQVAATGGAASPLTTLDTANDELEHGWPHALPDGALVFTVTERGRDPHVEVLGPGGERSRLRVPLTGQAQFIESGHLIYGYLGNLMAVRFDPEGRRISGVPVAVAKGIQTAGGFGVLGRTGLSVSRTGTLAWLRASPDDVRSRIVRVERDGTTIALSNSAEVFQTPRVSPDGRRLAVVVRNGIMTREIRILDAARPDRVMMTISGGDNQSPAWMDNRRLTFGSNRDGLQKIYVTAVNGARAPAPLFTADATAARNPASWSKPPRLLALYEIEPAMGRDVLVYRVGESISPVAAGNANERSPTVSPDGRWIAYVADPSGRDQIYATRLDRASNVLQLSTAGASEPVWTREGLFYREGERMMRRPVEKGEPGEPRLVFEGYFEHDPGSNLAAYDIDPQGRFIMLKSALRPRELRIVQNWGGELP